MSAFSKYLTKSLYASFPELSSLPFYVQNSLFHAKSEETVESLRSQGNKFFLDSQYERALMSYEQALCQLVWAELPGKLVVKEPTEQNSELEAVRKQTVCDLLMNVSSALMMLGMPNSATACFASSMPT